MAVEAMAAKVQLVGLEERATVAETDKVGKAGKLLPLLCRLGMAGARQVAVARDRVGTGGSKLHCPCRIIQVRKVVLMVAEDRPRSPWRGVVLVVAAKVMEERAPTYLRLLCQTKVEE